ncbi:65-kDa microtubule-associated protein 3-like [Cucurbita moschata]|uniref:65-kDa microtubule-associated protein 3-like n=1 Tax=Cucurbita moschata TaxID=3662 RepID=A0A6J1EKW0_CUCMO|nr:65-kDa microtubule-associated protein 3-like [Cucurbita moschata]
MTNVRNDPLLQMETTCGTLLHELQIIWDEVGESEATRDKMLLEVERECLEVYRRKVDQANRFRAQLRQAIADSEAELAAICSAMGERPVHTRQADQKAGTLKEEMARVLPQVDEMQKRKIDRRNQFLEVLEQIQKISCEIYGSEFSHSSIDIDENDLSLRKLEELTGKLHMLQKEKSDRQMVIQEHLQTLNLLCLVLGMDFKQTVNEFHPTLGDPEGPFTLTSESIETLAAAITNLREVKLRRMQRLQDLATTLLELWNLMDTPMEEQQLFQNVTCNIAASEDEVNEPNSLSVDSINTVEAEVSRLEELKSSKMKELVLKKKSELDEICRKTHLVLEEDTIVDYAIETLDSGDVDPAIILEQIELQVARIKGEAFVRKEILERVEKWLAACEEECWLEEYNRDENRYNAGRGTHLILKRAEKARALVNKLPGMVDALTAKTVAWENDRGTEFTYDGVRLLNMLEEYTVLRQEKEQERRRLRDQKKLQGQLIAEQEALYGSKPSPSKPQSVKKAPRSSAAGKRLSIGGSAHQTPKATPQSRSSRKSDQLNDQNYDEGFGSLPTAGRRELDFSGQLVSHNNSLANAREPELVTRKPFAPIATTVQPKTNTTNSINDENTASSDSSQKTSPTNNMPFATPLKKTSVPKDDDQGTMNPKPMTIPVPSTPSTLSVAMQTATTPAIALPPSAYKVEQIPDDDIEYSFEEQRAGFVLPKTHIKSIQV